LYADHEVTSRITYRAACVRSIGYVTPDLMTGAGGVGTIAAACYYEPN